MSWDRIGAPERCPGHKWSGLSTRLLSPDRIGVRHVWCSDTRKMSRFWDTNSTWVNLSLEDLRELHLTNPALNWEEPRLGLNLAMMHWDWISLYSVGQSMWSFSRPARSYCLRIWSSLENKEALLFSVIGPIQLRLVCFINILHS